MNKIYLRCATLRRVHTEQRREKGLSQMHMPMTQAPVANCHLMCERACPHTLDALLRIIYVSRRNISRGFLELRLLPTGLSRLDKSSFDSVANASLVVAKFQLRRPRVAIRASTCSSNGPSEGKPSWSFALVTTSLGVSPVIPKLSLICFTLSRSPPPTARVVRGDCTSNFAFDPVRAPSEMLQTRTS